MSRSDWSPARKVAENVTAGDRSYLNVVKIPDLGHAAASQAPRDFEARGLVTITHFCVEFTATFETVDRGAADRCSCPESELVPMSRICLYV